MNEQTIVMLVIAPHPDDAEFGIAGMVAGLALQGQEVAMLSLPTERKAARILQ
jgi:LmbE family N-acetylglucosaminyl deacetylase